MDPKDKEKLHPPNRIFKIHIKEETNKDFIRDAKACSVGYDQVSRTIYIDIYSECSNSLYEKYQTLLPSRGLGDTIEKITTLTGIKKAVENATKSTGCGCKKRRDNLNKTVPYWK